MLEPATESQTDTPSSGRLVIRIKLIPQEPPQPARWRFSRIALLIVVAGAALLSWLAVDTFRSDPTPPSAATEKAANARPAYSPPISVEPEAQQQPDAPPSSVNEVIPDVPQSALDTIRGTVRVSIRVNVDKQGAVVDATAHDRGPSRYFERLAVEAAKKWTFTPATSDEPRTMLVRFNFTRAGATADASPPQ